MWNTFLKLEVISGRTKLATHLERRRVIKEMRAGSVMKKSK